MKTIEELQKLEDDNIKKAQERKEYLKEKDWFIILSQKPFFDELGTVVFRLSELKDEMERFDSFHYKGKTEIVYKTNKWFEGLNELE